MHKIRGWISGIDDIKQAGAAIITVIVNPKTEEEYLIPPLMYNALVRHIKSVDILVGKQVIMEVNNGMLQTMTIEKPN